MIAGRVSANVSCSPFSPFSNWILQNRGQFSSAGGASPSLAAISQPYNSALSTSSNGVSYTDVNMQVCPPAAMAFASSSPSPVCSRSYAFMAVSRVLCTEKPYDPASLLPTTEPNAVSFMDTSSRSTSL